jgi:hypothetical protein
MTNLNAYAMQRMWENIARDNVKEAVFWLGLLANNGEPKSHSETVH